MIGPDHLKIELKIDKSKFLKEEHKNKNFKSQMSSEKNKVRDENEEIEEVIEKRNQVIKMVDMRIRELERFIDFGNKPKFLQADDNVDTEIGDNISATTRSNRSFRTTRNRDPNKNLRIMKAAGGVQKRISDKLEFEICHLPIPKYAYVYNLYRNTLAPVEELYHSKSKVIYNS
jgi:hypothetical protein